MQLEKFVLLVLRHAAVGICCGILAVAPPLWSQDPSPATEATAAALRNGGCEEGAMDAPPDGWQVVLPAGAQASLVTENPAAGARAVLIDTTAAADPRPFANLLQSLDAHPWRGKRIRFRAAVRTAERHADGRAQLWMRIDRAETAGKARTTAFDNMAARPIRSDEWQHYDIVLPVDADAESIVLGIMVLGTARAWFDDATVEEVSAETPTTGEDGGRASRFAFAPILQKAFAEADRAPQQPFFTLWLLVPLVALLLFFLAHWPPLSPEDAYDWGEPPTLPGPLAKFAFRFSCAYWLLYCFPEPFGSLLPVWGATLSTAYQQGVQAAVGWVAAHVFGIGGELIPPNGSGDTTSSYLTALIVFVLALAVAAVWSLLDRRETDYRTLKDLLRSYLRYVLALSMLMYGLAKLNLDRNQFPTPGPEQLARTWGESSPMGAVWSFMGASRAYTMFAGLGELTAALLLLFRRTSTLGALIALGVMTNVMMLNYCYDIPVKLYSTHLVVMALYLLLYDAPRLASVLWLNRPLEAADLRPPYVHSVAAWRAQRFIKLAVLVVGFGIPCGLHVQRQTQYLAAWQAQPAFFGTYEVDSYTLAGQPVSPESPAEPRWSKVTFQLLGYNREFEPSPTYWVNIELAPTGRLAGCFQWDEAGHVDLDESSRANFPWQQLRIEKVGEDALRVTAETAQGPLAAHLRRVTPTPSRLMSRGYRWINEVPFNR